MKNTTHSIPSAMPEITMNSLIKTVEEFKAKLPVPELLGMEMIENPFLPPGVSLMGNETSMAIIYHETGKILILERDSRYFDWHLKQAKKRLNWSEDGGGAGVSGSG